MRKYTCHIALSQFRSGQLMQPISSKSSDRQTDIMIIYTGYLGQTTHQVNHFLCEFLLATCIGHSFNNFPTHYIYIFIYICIYIATSLYLLVNPLRNTYLPPTLPLHLPRPPTTPCCVSGIYFSSVRRCVRPGRDELHQLK